MPLELITPPTEEPISLSEAKAHLRVDVSDEDTLIRELISVARRSVEVRTGRALITQSWAMTLPEAPSAPIVLPRQPATAITSVSVIGIGGARTPLSTGLYRLETAEPSRLLPQGAWPSCAGAEVVFSAGYGAASDVPEDLRQAVRLLLAHFYERRELAESDRFSAVPDALDGLLAPYRSIRL